MTPSRKRGAQPHNTNALRHGFYSRYLRQAELKDLDHLERLRRLEDLDCSLRKWIYLALSFLILGFISLLFDLLPRVVNLL